MRHLALIVLGIFFLHATPAWAQDDQWPEVGISSSVGSSTTAASATITVDWCDPPDESGFRGGGLSSGTRQILLNGVSVTTSFSYTGASRPGICKSAARSIGTLTLASGANVIQASINDIAGHSGSESITVTRIDRVAATIDTTANPGDFRDPAKCILDCFEKVLTYAMPGYVSRNTARGVTLVYRSGRARPVGTVILSARNNSPASPVKLSLKLWHPDGYFETFINGRNELFFQNGATIVGHIALTGATRRVSYAAVVTSYWADGSISTTARAPMLIVNEESSPYGAGVGIAGLQRLYLNPGADGVIITEGSGGASYFSGTCAVTTICQYRAPAGDFSTLSTDGTAYVRRYPDGTAIVFNADGYNVSTVDRFANITSYAYAWNPATASYLLQTVTDPAGFTTSLSYREAGGNPWYRVGSLGAITQNVGSGRSAYFGIDQSNDLRHWVEQDGSYFAAVDYDGLHRMAYVRDQNGGSWNFAYASNGTLSQISAPLSELGNGVQQRPTTNITGPGVNVANALQSAPDTPIPTTLDQRASVTNPRGFATYYRISRFGAMLGVGDPAGHTVAVEYNADGLPTLITPSVGQPTTITWDGPRKMTELRGTSQTNYAYGAAYDQPTRIWGSSPEQVMTYDASKTGSPLLTTRLGTNETRYVFTSDGRILSQTDALGHGTTWAYEPGGFQNVAEVRAVTASGEKKTSYTYDAFGRTNSVKDPTGATSQTIYDVRNRVTQTTGPRSDVTQYVYDGIGNITRVTDAKNQSYQFGRNVLGWLLTQTQPDGGVERMVYDVNGLIASFTNRRGQTVTATYDNLDRIVSRYQQAEGVTTTFGYDWGGAWTAVSNGVSTDTVKLNYDFQVESQFTGRNGFSRSVRASYDAASRRTGVNVLKNGLSGDSISYGYGTAGQLAAITDPLGNRTNIGYNVDYQPETFSFAGGLVATNSYSASHALTGTSFNVSGIDQAFGRYYTRDSVSRVRESSDRQNKARRFLYDPAGQLTNHSDLQTYRTYCRVDKDYGRVCDQAPESYLGGRGYAYDAVGNPTDAGVSPGPANRVAAINGDALEYDADGNLVHRYRMGSPSTFEQTYSWNSLGQLVQVVTTRNGGTNVAQYAYDGAGRRAVKTISGVSTTHYIWDGEQIVAEVDWSGSTQQIYTYYPGADQLHSVVTGYQNANPQTYYAATDAAGNVIGLTSRSYNIVMDAYSYQPFGTMDRNDQNVPSSLRWKGLPYDAETGLYYMRARYYAPDLGRFISEDPIGLQGGINAYTFAGNDPVNGNDPTGLKCYVVTVGGIGGGADQASTTCDPWWVDELERFSNFARSSKEALGLTANWFFSTGKQLNVYRTGSIQVDELRSDPHLTSARAEVCGSSIPGYSAKGSVGMTNVRDVWNAGANMTRQYVGSYTYSASKTSSGGVKFAAQNVTSVSSLMHYTKAYLHGAEFPSWNRQDGTLMGNTQQVFVWTEACR